MCSSFSLKGDCAASLALAVAPTTPPRLLQSAEGTSSGPRLECLFSFLPLFNQLCLCFRSIDIRGSGPREHHRQHHATGGHQQHQPPHHHLGLGQEEQEHQHTVAHGWCPRWNDHAPPTCLFPAATGQCRELWPHGSPWYYVVSDSAGPGGEATMSRGLDRWVEGREDMASRLHLPVGHCECAARLPTDPCGTRASISGARSCLPSGLHCLGEAWQAAGWGQSLSTQSTVCRIFGIPSSGQRRVQANDLVGLSLMCYKSLCFQKLCTMSLLSLVLPVFVAPGLIDGCVDGWCFACLRGGGGAEINKTYILKLCAALFAFQRPWPAFQCTGILWLHSWTSMSDFFKLQSPSSVISRESRGENKAKYFKIVYCLLDFAPFLLLFPPIVFFQKVAFGNFLSKLKHGQMKNGFWHMVQFAVF